MVEIAIFAGIGLILDKLTFTIWAQGGSISLVMVPIVLMAIRWGLAAGLTTGFLIGVLQIAFGAHVYHWVQGLLDYGIAFTGVGLAAVIRKPLLQASSNGHTRKMVFYIVLGTILGGSIRFAAHLIAGVVFFAEYAGDQNVWLYSIIYNCSYMIPAIILTAIAASMLFTSAPKLLQKA